MTLHGCSLLDNAGAYCPEDEQSDIGTWMCHQRCFVEDIALNGGLHLISSAEGIQSGLEFIHLLGVAVATTPKGALLAKSPFGIPVAPNSVEHSITN